MADVDEDTVGEERPLDSHQRPGVRTGSKLVALLRGENSPLVSEEPSDSDASELVELEIASIAIGPHPIREVGEEADLAELAASIATKGVLQPILVRPIRDGPEAYELVAGERRLRAAALSGRSVVPAIVHHFTDQEAVEVAIVENAQRENLNPIEEALAYRILSTDFHLSQTQIAEVVGKNRVTIANALRLLTLEPDVVEMLKGGELSAGHGRALLRVRDPKLQLTLAKRAARLGLSVRTLEALAAHNEGKADESDGENDSEPTEEEMQLARLESRVSTYLGLERVKLRTDTAGHKRLQLVFETEAAWKRFLSRIRS